MIDLTATIAAISTPVGMGATATLRVSGKDAIDTVGKLFISNSGKPLSEQVANTIRFGKITQNGETIDEVLLAVYKGPHSFTGEDVVEIFCHGSVYIQQRILQALIDSGTQMAQPGEFTMRAYLNGKMDLAQAEAVGDLISSSTQSMHKLAMQQMRGGYSEEIRGLRDKLLHFVSLIELELDFSDEDVEFANRDELVGLLREIINVINRLTKSFAVGNAIKRGIPVAIVGKPNVGKSTLLNALLNDDKAIVSDIAGTTRDAIEDTITIGGVLFRFIDTAGLRHTTDTIEMLGIERSRKKLEQASIALLVADYTEDIKTLTETINNLTSEVPSKDSQFIVLLNKADLLSNGERQDKLKQLNVEKATTLLPISAKGKLGLGELENLLVKYASIPENLENNSIVSNVRHYEAFIKAQEALGKALEGINTNLSEELISFEIREAIQHLSNIIGDISDTDVLSNIFSKFCIGK